MTDQPDHLRIPARPSGDPNDVTNGQLSVIDAPVDTQLDTTPVDLDADTPNREAAKYRTRLRTLESENSTLTLQVAALQRAQISAQVADAGLRPDAVFKTSELETMLDPETGAVDPGRVAAAIRFARSALGIEVHGGLRGLPEGNNPTTRSQGTFTGAFTPPAEPRRR